MAKMIGNKVFFIYLSLMAMMVVMITALIYLNYLKQREVREIMKQQELEEKKRPVPKEVTDTQAIEQKKQVLEFLSSPQERSVTGDLEVLLQEPEPETQEEGMEEGPPPPPLPPPTTEDSEIDKITEEKKRILETLSAPETEDAASDSLSKQDKKDILDALGPP